MFCTFKRYNIPATDTWCMKYYKGNHVLFWICIFQYSIYHTAIYLDPSPCAGWRHHCWSVPPIGQDSALQCDQGWEEVDWASFNGYRNMKSQHIWSVTSCSRWGIFRVNSLNGHCAGVTIEYYPVIGFVDAAWYKLMLWIHSAKPPVWKI